MSRITISSAPWRSYFRRAFGRIARVAKALETDPFHDPAVRDVEAWDDPSRKP
jgi:hypothetical protein